MVDVRREFMLRERQKSWFHDLAGESVIWFEFLPFGTDPDDSQYDDLYDEGGPSANSGRKWASGVIVPYLWLIENEDSRRSIPQGRKTFQTLRFVTTVTALAEAGISNPEEHRSHLRDIIGHQGRLYLVSDYIIRGRLRRDDNVIVSAVETYPDEEMVYDVPPSLAVSVDGSWPSGFPDLP
jgi:hypothetical protein